MYIDLLKEEFPLYDPKELLKKAAERWKDLPQDLRNSFIIYAFQENLIRRYVTAKSTVPPPSSTNIFDSIVKDEFEDFFNECIKQNAYL
jgi:hypothetical protein